MHSETGDQEPAAQEREVSRRTFLSYVNVAIGAFITAILGIPLVGAAVLPALSKNKGHEVTAGAVADFQTDQPKNVAVTITIEDGWVQTKEDKGIWVVKHSDTEFTVYNGRCVHLGCAYNWVPDAKLFECPCHGGRYTIDGKVVGGPPPRPLDTLQWKLNQGQLVVNYEDFQLGVPQKEPV